jgi:hypothetical protein
MYLGVKYLRNVVQSLNEQKSFYIHVIGIYDIHVVHEIR